MYEEYYFPSKGAGDIHVCRWSPEGRPVAVIQILHGIADMAERYDDFASWLAGRGFLVVAEDHMGHGKSINGDGVVGYFHGGWFCAVDDSYRLLELTREEFPNIPYVLFGHSMGSFMARTILCRYPESGISGAVICGTAWQPRALLPAVRSLCRYSCRKHGEKNRDEKLQKLVFINYNARVEHPRTPYDWLTRDPACVDAYVANPLCGDTSSCGLLRDMMEGLIYIENVDALAKMDRTLPILFIAGGDDPVGNYGKGVARTVQEFRKVGMQDVSCKIYPLARHEVLNELNREEVYRDVSSWLEQKIN